MSQSIREYSLIGTSVIPSINSFTIRSSVSIVTLVDIAILEDLLPNTMFQILSECSCIDISVCCCKCSLSLSHSILPISYIYVSVDCFPFSQSMLNYQKGIWYLFATSPFTGVVIPLRPTIKSFTFRQSIEVLTIVQTSILQLFETFSLLKVILPESFIHVISPQENTLSLLSQYLIHAYRSCASHHSISDPWTSWYRNCPLADQKILLDCNF